MNFLEQLSSESDLTRLLDSIYDGVYIVNRQRKILFWNKAAEQMTGYTKAEVMGKSCGDNILNHIDENGMLLCRSACPILKVFANQKPLDTKVYPKARDGRRFPVETHISLVYDEAGQIIAAIEVFRDISQQEEYRILQEKFNAMIRKYVSSTTYSDVKARLSNDNHRAKPKVQDLTVFYLDIVNFTTFSENNQPEDVVNMLNELFGICEVITKECFGDIDKFIGDAIMAVFSDANDAVRAALQILYKSLPEMNRIRQENNEAQIDVRIGINSGMLLQGDIGTLDRKDLTVIGDTVNIAARLEKNSVPNRLLISEATFSRLDKELASNFTEQKSMELKGKTEKIHTFMNKV